MITEKEITQLGKEALAAEIAGMTALAKSFPSDFAPLVKKILSTKGRIILTGIGKSAIIARKITATLNSTGTPSIFMHAAEAIHGDLGMVQKEDLIIALSHSGNTPEIKYLAGLISKMGNPLACICGNADSALAKESKWVLAYHIEKEACPLNLAPTTSTTLQLALGDALAVALLSSRHFTAKDFSKYHPGGNLGKKIYLTCGEIAKQNEKPSVQITDPIKKVIVEISERRLGATAVFEKKKLVGIITDGDIRRMLEKNVNLQTLTAKEIMSKNPKTFSSKNLAAEALELLKQFKISQLIITDESEKYIGMIHIHDLYKEGLI
ncbi:MAG: KpsF/GutQ family sugar-phosphate isomerase [Bacteroidetes bacterium]|nr:KpsF/GutQ family sugar-phosphate isomerase [Bacteroidota bacterium]